MLEAAVAEMDGAFSLSAPTMRSAYAVRSRLGLLQTAQIQSRPRLSLEAGRLIPQKFQDHFGIVPLQSITGVLDASGFAYSDSFPLTRISTEAAFSRIWETQNAPLIMLPQAFGPFEQPEKRRQTRELLSRASMIFARDAVSETHLETLDLDTPIVRSPDFTIGLPPLAVRPPFPENTALLVPNSKLISQGVFTAAEYSRLMVQYGHSLSRLGLHVRVLVHEEHDSTLGMELGKELNVAVISDPRPRILKAYLGASVLVVSSRYHAAVGALSQEVPTIALGWSHKYLELMQDFGVPSWCAETNSTPEALVRQVINDGKSRKQLSDRKRSLLKDVESMWQTTRNILKRKVNT